MSTVLRALLLIAVLAVAAVAVAIATIDTGSPADSSTGELSVPAATSSGGAHAGHSAPAVGRRTLLVTRGAEPEPSQSGSTMNALRTEGEIPRGATMATVVTDEDCAPDAAGVSHCTNRLRLADGRGLTVRHPHRMSEVACMTPGEEVRVKPA